MFPPNSISLVYAHAFFEHIFRNKHAIILNKIRSILNRNGVLIIIGIPDFAQIAEAYLKNKKGFFSNKFDLQHVFRYTHGGFDLVDDRIGQLHKYVFDSNYIHKLLNATRFKNHKIFTYAFRDEYLPINIGFIASKNSNIKFTQDSIKKELSQLNSDVNLKSIRIVQTGKIG